ncbi:hypothetical protein EDD22DRAFT_960178 [Suillus occidentalis]|nr:hypothetical protein EDD22DRAFT_960178 [Suillus occidentalis]
MSNAEGSVPPTDELVEGSGSASHVEHQHAEGTKSGENQAEVSAARQRRKIAQLEEKLATLESGRAAKERQTNYYVAQGRAIRRVVTLFDSLEDLVAENDRRYEFEEDAETTAEYQDFSWIGYMTFTKTMRWFHQKATEADYKEYADMLKMLRQGADAARGDDTSKLKPLVSEWVNREFKPDPPVDPDDKYSRGFINDACGRLLCPSELDWNNSTVKAGIRDRADGYTVTDMSFPAFVYEKYTANPDDLEDGLFKGKILLQAFKAVFTSPSSAKDVEGDGDGADVIISNRRARKSFNTIKVKKHVAQIIKMEKVTPRSIAYIVCQVRFALSSVTSWRSIDGDFDYVHFWRIIVDFFEKPPGRDARLRAEKLLEWWTRKVFGKNRRNDLSQTVMENMSVNALARQRAARADAVFNSP